MSDINMPVSATQVASSAAWVIGWRVSTRVLGFINTFILIRFLAPADFGLIMLATTFTDAVDALSALGIQDAVVRQKAPDRVLYDTAFTMNAVRCLATACFIGAAAWPTASFFAEPNLANVLLALALVSAAGAAENIRLVDFRREMAFQQEFMFFLLPRLAAIVACVAAAAVWHSYWALIVGLTTNRLLQLVLGYILRPYQPRLCLRGWRVIIGFSLWTWLSSLVALIRDRSDNIVIGRALGVRQVGLFSVGAELAALPTTELVAPICRVLFPSFTAARSAGEDLAELYFRTIATTILVTMPAGIGISMVAAPIVALVIGPQWSATVPIVAVLAIAGTLKVISLISGTLFAAIGLLTVNFRIIAVTAVVRVAMLVVLVQGFGLVGGAVAILLSVLVEETLFLATAAHKLGFPAWELPRRAWRSLTASAAMVAMLTLTGLGWSAASTDPAMRLLAAVSLGTATYFIAIASTWALAGRPAGAELYAIQVVVRAGSRLSGVLRHPHRGL